MFCQEGGVCGLDGWCVAWMDGVWPGWTVCWLYGWFVAWIDNVLHGWMMCCLDGQCVGSMDGVLPGWTVCGLGGCSVAWMEGMWLGWMVEAVSPEWNGVWAACRVNETTPIISIDSWMSCKSCGMRVSSVTSCVIPLFCCSSHKYRSVTCWSTPWSRQKSNQRHI